MLMWCTNEMYSFEMKMSHIHFGIKFHWKYCWGIATFSCLFAFFFFFFFIKTFLWLTKKSSPSFTWYWRMYTSWIHAPILFWCMHRLFFDRSGSACNNYSTVPFPVSGVLLYDITSHDIVIVIDLTLKNELIQKIFPNISPYFLFYAHAKQNHIGFIYIRWSK